MQNYHTGCIFKYFLLGLASILATGCTSLLFHPLEQHVRTPEDIGVIYEDVILQTRDHIKLHGWFLPAQGTLKGSVYFLHGNAENISTHIASVYWLPEQGYQVFLLDYRGFGASSGKPGLPEIFLDIEAGLTWLLKHNEGQPVFLLGQSLGASLAIYFAANNRLAQQNLAGVISDAAFTSYLEITRHVAGNVWLTWPFQYPIAWAMNYPYNPIDCIARLAPVPVLLLHSRNDEIIPFTYARQLYTAAKQPKYFQPTQGRHNETFIYIKNRYVVLDFLKWQAISFDFSGKFNSEGGASFLAPPGGHEEAITMRCR